MEIRPASGYIAAVPHRLALPVAEGQARLADILVTAATTADTQPIIPSQAPADYLTSDFSIREGNQTHWFVWSGDAASHVIVTDAANPRVLFTYPDENTGTGIWFDPSRNPGLQISFATPPRAFVADGGQGVAVEVRANRSEVLLTEFVLDSVRTLRVHALGEGGGKDGIAGVRGLRKAYAAAHSVPEGWVEEQARVAGRKVRLERTALQGGAYSLHLDLAPNVTATLEGRGVRLRTADGSPVAFKATSFVPHPPMQRYAPEELLRQETLDTLRALEREASQPGAGEQVRKERTRFAEALRGLLFLSRQEKFMAGAWRFMTYFGRDTMISLMLLEGAITPKGYRDGLQSVLDRLNKDGDVAHEEDIGPWAELHHARAGEVKDDPVYDYKMVDDDFLLPIMAARYLTDRDVPPAERKAFLDHRGADGRTNLEKLLSNWDFVLKKASAYPATLTDGNPANDHESLIRILDTEKVGNWRDSEAGLGNGRWPADVNADLVLYALEAIRDVLGSGVVSPDAVKAMAGLKGLEALAMAPRAGALAAAWEKAEQEFEVSLSAAQVRDRLAAFLAGSAVTPAERDYYRGLRFSDGITLGAFVDGAPAPPELRAPLRFWSLSLDERGNPVPVPNSDFGFRLYLGHPSAQEVEDMLRLVELPYPIGLMTPVGPVVANAAYEPSLWKSLSRDSYHGAVVWSWQASLLQMGILEQLERFRAVPGQEALARRLESANARIEASMRAAGPLANSELWTFEIEQGQMVPLAFGQRKGSETESNAVQLWSTVYPALYMKSKAAQR